MMLGSLLLLAPLALAPQRDLDPQEVTSTGRVGRVNDGVFYGPLTTVGWEVDGSGRRLAMRYDETGPLVLGSFTPFGDSEARGVSANGRIVGWSEAFVRQPGRRAARLRRRPFVFTETFGFRGIPLAGATEGWAEDISIFDHEVVGTLRQPDGRLRAWFFETGASTATELLSTPAGWQSEAPRDQRTPLR